jgi:8-oxo-dGTP pyrophosphatase MutT (NUDIX family)
MTRFKKNKPQPAEDAACVSALEQRIRGWLPGLPAQLKMSPRPRPGHKTYKDVADTCLRAGVLLLLYPWEGRLHFILTKRTERLSHHQAQISLPGGRQDKRESLIQTALREAHEELGVCPESVRILGILTPLYIPPSNYCIHPVVSFVSRRPNFLPSPREVAEIIEVPVEDLLDAKNRVEEVWTINGMKVSVPFYAFGAHKIWGATAMVLSEFLDLLRDTNEEG